ncbi:hypothetical protein D4Z93_11760 [Clostridium fermenticellae]|uniref:Uncharacterized protein n=1 Tax=Clostridium fermenticellae TaxID=2068654 RepID=A0A386H6J0_9CLOT|nr:hypothetical protein [Clostridium fermenticellae]AYD41153.1 hypothetical protein D4Z93_11760 [Clostridium fermenticellae]
MGNILLDKISRALDKCCDSRNITKLDKIIIVVNENSRLDSSELYNYLRSHNDSITHKLTEVKIEFDDLPDQVVIIKSIEGEDIEGMTEN